LGEDSKLINDTGRFKMCEAHAFILNNDREEMILENVDQVDIDGDEVRIVNIFGEQKILRARIKSYNGTKNKILLEPL
jgi:predicted RNA-binding protein